MIVLWSSGFHCMDAWVGLSSSWFAVVVQIALFGILAGTVRVGLRSWQRRRAEHGTSGPPTRSPVALTVGCLEPWAASTTSVRSIVQWKSNSFK